MEQMKFFEDVGDAMLDLKIIKTCGLINDYDFYLSNNTLSFNFTAAFINSCF